MIIEYIGVIIAIILTLFFAIFLFIISYFLIFREYDIEKLSAYECGFGLFEDTRDIFDVRFYLVAILFLIFDLEIIYLFP